MTQTKYLLDESDIPTQWYNVVADMPNPPLPPIGLDSQPLAPEALGVIFPEALLAQEMSAERWIPIPEPVREALRMWRPSPLYRAHRLEQLLGTPAHIYYKYEGVSPAGSHKPNTAVAQAYYNAGGGHPRARHRDGRGTVGLGPRTTPASSSASTLKRLHGEGERSSRSRTGKLADGDVYGAEVVREPDAG